jgi:hypothetical protein
MTKGVQVFRYKPPRDTPSGRAYCQGLGCGWAQDCTRERARQHVAKTGHTVHYTVEQITIYQRDSIVDAEIVEGPS